MTSTKGKKRVMKMNDFTYITYYCKRCGIWVWEGKWKDGTHDSCDKHMKGKAIRDKVDMKLFGKKL